MSRRPGLRSGGFSLVEMTLSLALGVMVVGAGVGLYSRGVNATWIVTQRAEMQQDFRAAADMMTRDISLAGASMGNNVQIALPSGNGAQIPIYGCDQTPKCYINGAAVAYPTQLVNGVKVPYLYGLIPGLKFGPIVNAGAGQSDVITVVNADTTFLLNCYNVTVTTSTLVTFGLNPNPAQRPGNCVVPPPLLNPQAITDAVVGLTPGDLIQLNVSNPGAGANAPTSNVIGEVTKVQDTGTDAKGNHTYAVSFAANDPLLMNQPTAAAGSLGNVVGSTGTGNRINVVTYYIDNSLTPPRLMRQNSGHTPIPVAESVSFLQFTYDLYNFDTGAILTRQADGGASQGMTPNQITKINIEHMSMASTMYGTRGYQGLDLQTSVSARDLTFKNDYPLQ